MFHWLPVSSPHTVHPLQPSHKQATEVLCQSCSVPKLCFRDIFTAGAVSSGMSILFSTVFTFLLSICFWNEARSMHSSSLSCSQERENTTRASKQTVTATPRSVCKERRAKHLYIRILDSFSGRPPLRPSFQAEKLNCTRLLHSITIASSRQGLITHTHPAPLEPPPTSAWLQFRVTWQCSCHSNCRIFFTYVPAK